MKLRLLFLSIFVTSITCGQILTFDFAGLTGSEVSATSNFNDPNLNNSTISRGSGLTATNNGDRFNATNWATGSIANALSGSNYMEFTITPNSGYQFSVSSIDLKLQRSGTGPSELVLRNSLDGYSSNLDTQYAIIDNTTTQTFTFTFSQLNSLIPVVYRVYMYAESTGGSGGIGDFTGNDIVVNGLVSLACTPPSDPGGSISVTSSCGSSSLTYSSPSATAYWQTTATGTDTTFPTTSSYAASVSGTYYVRIFDGSCWSTGTVSQLVTVNNSVFISINPSNQSAVVGTTATFTVAADNAITYQWQESTDGGSLWFNVGANSASYSIPTVALGMDGYLYRVLISGMAPCGSTNSTEASLTVTATAVSGGTAFSAGDLIFTGYDGQINGSGPEDEYLVATLVDILPGTIFSIVNSRYEAGALAGVRTNKWGGGGNNPSEAPYQIDITYNGSTTITAGSAMQIITDGSANWFGTINVITNNISSNRTSDFSGNVVGGAFLTPNISTSSPDQMYLIQGNFTSDGSIDANEANYYLNGTLLHGLTNRAAWVPLANACSGSSDTTSANPRESRLPASLTCFNVESISSSAVSAYYENDKEHGSASVYQIINAVADVPNNWTLGTGRYNLNPSNITSASAGKSFVIGASNPSGQWVGDVDTNWFNCANWSGLAVPDVNTNVLVDVSATNVARIDYTAAFSDDYSDLAVCNNITISGSKVELYGNENNVIEVFGDLVLESTGVLDVDDSNNATLDGTIVLHGNWTNTSNNDAFEEGNGIVIFKGLTDQLINPVSPEGTEVFHNVILNNNFTTSVSNNLIVTGDLLIEAGKVVTVNADDYIQVNNDLTVNGTLSILNDGSLVQVNDLGLNTGAISYERTTTGNSLDYVYWSAPLEANTTPGSGHIYTWNTTLSNANGGLGYWVSATGTTMQSGVGYIMRDVFTRTFNGVPRNGVVSTAIQRGNYTGSNYTGVNGITITNFHDNLNLVGNPYPSSINAIDFLNANTNIEGAIRLWTHGISPSAAIQNPFYGSYQLNYSSNDYIIYNSMGSSSGPGTFNGFIAGGQGFFTIMNDGAATSDNITFNNSMRSKTFDNSQFYKNAYSKESSIEKHRIWLALNNSNHQTSKTLIGYMEGATMGKDRMYDAVALVSTETSIYSIVDSKNMVIQGRFPFSDDDLVPLGVKITSSGSNSMGLLAVDGLFQGQDIFLEDLYLNTIHDLKSAAYTFTSPIGVFDDRFVLKFKPSSLNGDDFSVSTDLIQIILDQDVQIQSLSNRNIKSVQVYDVLARNIFEANSINNTFFTINNLMRNHAPLFLKIELEDNTVFAKKIIF